MSTFNGANSFVTPPVCISIACSLPQCGANANNLRSACEKLGIDIVQTFFVEGHLVGGAAARMAGVKAIVSSRRNLGYSYSLKEKLLLKTRQPLSASLARKFASGCRHDFATGKYRPQSLRRDIQRRRNSRRKLTILAKRRKLRVRQLLWSPIFVR